LAVYAPRAAALALAKSEAHADLNDPATDVFTDLRVAPGVVVPAAEPLEETRRLMQLAGVRMAFVVDAAERVIGLVVLADLQGERPTLEARSRSATVRDLAVTDVMTPVPLWDAVDVGSIAKARIGHVVATFRATGQRYLIVTEEQRDSHGATHTLIRGLFSANRVERAIGHPIEVELRSRNFAELTSALANS
jgi:CBS domain containing-hemolysin-like protein